MDALNKGNGKGAKRPLQCHRCKGHGHPQFLCPSGDTPNQNITCTNCKGRGHGVAQCPSKGGGGKKGSGKGKGESRFGKGRQQGTVSEVTPANEPWMHPPQGNDTQCPQPQPGSPAENWQQQQQQQQQPEQYSGTYWEATPWGAWKPTQSVGSVAQPQPRISLSMLRLKPKNTVDEDGMQFPRKTARPSHAELCGGHCDGPCIKIQNCFGELPVSDHGGDEGHAWPGHATVSSTSETQDLKLLKKERRKHTRINKQLKTKAEQMDCDKSSADGEDGDGDGTAGLGNGQVGKCSTIELPVMGGGGDHSKAISKGKGSGGQHIPQAAPWQEVNDHD